MNNTLITGATGFLGSALLDKLKATDNVTLLVRPISSLEQQVSLLNELHGSNVKIIYGDICDYNLMCRVIADNEITHVYHCAANSIVRICANNPMGAYQTNVMGTVTLLEAIRTVGMNNIKSVVVSTSDKAYGHSPAPYNEDTPFSPKYTYESTKSCQDIVAQNYFHNYGLPVKVVRCSNLYGPGDPNESRLIPNSIKKLMAGSRPVLYTGVADYQREFTYISDAVNAFKLIGEESPPGENYCVGSVDGPIKILDLAIKISDTYHLVNDSTSADEKVELVERAANFKEIEIQSIDDTKLHGLGWNPHINLEEGLKRTILFYQEEELYNV